MKCKYCQAELETNSSVCPKCGKDNLKDDLKVLKIVALVLTCVVMLVLLAGLVNYGVTGSFLPDWLKKEELSDEEKFQAAMDDVVATMGEHKLTNRQLQMYYWMAAYNDTGKADLTKDLSTQIYDEATGKTYEEYFIEQGIESWQEVMLMADAAKEAGYELPEDAVESLANMKSELESYVYMYAYYYGYDLTTVDDLIQMQFGPGCNYDTYYEYTYNYYLGGLYWTEMMEDLEVTDQQINDYFAENEESLANDYGIPITKDFGNLVDIRNILILVEGTEVEDEEGKKTTTITDEDWAECLAKAEELLNQWKSGEATEDSFAALVAGNSKDDGSSGNEGLYTDLYKNCLNEVDVRHILIFPKGATASNVTTQEWSDEAWTWAQTEAQRILDEWKAGEMTEDSFGALANEHSDDNGGNVTNGGLYEDVYLGQMVKNFEDWCFEEGRQTGDTGIVKTEYGYHVMYFVRADNEADNWVFAEERQTGDTAILKTDEGYQIVYFVGAEPAWYRYCRYGVQGEKGEAMIEELRQANPYTVDNEKIVLGDIT